MFYPLARRALFSLPPEKAHDIALQGLKRMHRMGLASLFAARAGSAPRTVMGLEFPNPVGVAAGLDKNGDYIDALGAVGFGFLEIGTVTPLAQPGNPKPRVFRLPQAQALINRLGFNNKGVDYLVQRVREARYRGILGINIGKNKVTPTERAVDDYVACLRKVYPFASYITVNVSSPNTEGLRDLQGEAPLSELLDVLLDERDGLASRHGERKPLLLKVAPDLDAPGFNALVRVLNARRPDGVIATNTTVDHSAVRELPHGEESGGLSGAPLFQRATRILGELRKALDTDIPLIGVGGILSADDAAAKGRAGADLVQIYTGYVYQGAGLIRDAVRALASS